MMCAINSLKNKWWDSVNVLIRGASTKLILEDEEVQMFVKEMIAGNVTLEACKACADLYGAEDFLKNLGVEVKYTGATLTEYITNDDKLITI